MTKVVILSSTGISAESVLSISIDSDNLWGKYKIEDIYCKMVSNEEISFYDDCIIINFICWAYQI